jgi:hypothetical protein
VVGIITELIVWLAALARAAFELLRRELREGIAAMDYPEPILGDPGYPDDRE